ncbi:hypothetical protein N5V81_26480 [Escherichia coli]|nr:hypothetical protein [Escherichia coli]
MKIFQLAQKVVQTGSTVHGERLTFSPDPGKDMVVWQLINNIGIPIFDEAVKIYFELDD